MSDQQACTSHIPTQNVMPILHEIRHAMAKLLESDVSTIIDLRAMPFAPGEEDELEAKLGQGEVRVEISALGPSEIKETTFAGVWLVTHYNNEHEVLGKFIEITRVPGILKSQSEDIQGGLAQLEDMLSNGS